MAYGIRFRRHVLKIKEQVSLSLVKVGQRFGIRKQTIYAWSKQLEPKKTRGKKSVKIDMEAIKRAIEEHPDGYLYDLETLWSDARGYVVCS